MFVDEWYGNEIWHRRWHLATYTEFPLSIVSFSFVSSSVAADMQHLILL